MRCPHLLHCGSFAMGLPPRVLSSEGSIRILTLGLLFLSLRHRKSKVPLGALTLTQRAAVTCLERHHDRRTARTIKTIYAFSANTPLHCTVTREVLAT